MLDLKCEIENNILFTKEKSNNKRIRRSVTVTVKFTMKKKKSFSVKPTHLLSTRTYIFKLNAEALLLQIQDGKKN